MQKTEYQLLSNDCLEYSRSISAGFPLVREDVSALLLRASEAISSLESKSMELRRISSNKDLMIAMLKAKLFSNEES